jgi:predicted transcriptional regulator of viral defense system
MEKVINIFRKHFGYAYLKDLKKQGVHTDTVRNLALQGKIEKIKPGLYKLVDMPMLANQGMIDVYMSMPRAVVCLHSALSYYDLTTTMPDRVMVALRRQEKPSKIQYPPVQVFYYSEKNYHTGIKEVKTESGNFKIYESEKTIVDCFRYRNKLGLDVATEGLKNYLKGKQKNLVKLTEYAKTGRMYKIMKPYMEAIIEQ